MFIPGDLSNLNLLWQSHQLGLLAILQLPRLGRMPRIRWLLRLLEEPAGHSSTNTPTPVALKDPTVEAELADSTSSTGTPTGLNTTEVKSDEATPASSAEAPADRESSAKTSPGAEGETSEAEDEPHENIPMVSRQDQQALKEAKQPRKPRGRKPNQDKDKEKSGKETKMKRPAAAKRAPRKRAASKPPAEEPEKEEEEEEEEEDTEMSEAKRDLDQDFAEAESDADMDEAEPEAKPVRKSRSKKDKKVEKSESEKLEKKEEKGKVKKQRGTDEEGCKALPMALTGKSGTKRVTFAGRNAPKSIEANNRFTVLLKTFTDKIQPFISKSSSQVEVEGPNTW